MHGEKSHPGNSTEEEGEEHSVQWPLQRGLRMWGDPWAHLLGHSIHRFTVSTSLLTTPLFFRSLEESWTVSSLQYKMPEGENETEIKLRKST